MLTIQYTYMCVLWNEVTYAQVLDAHTDVIHLMHCLMHVLYQIVNCTTCYMLCMIIDMTAKAQKQDCNGKEAPIGRTWARELTGGPPALPTPQC